MLFAGGFLGVCETDVVFLNTTETRQHCPRIINDQSPVQASPLFLKVAVFDHNVANLGQHYRFLLQTRPPHTPHPLPASAFFAAAPPSRATVAVCAAWRLTGKAAALSGDEGNLTLGLV
jgi:hypothetical protein